MEERFYRWGLLSLLPLMSGCVTKSLWEWAEDRDGYEYEILCSEINSMGFISPDNDHHQLFFQEKGGYTYLLDVSSDWREQPLMSYTNNSASLQKLLEPAVVFDLPPLNALKPIPKLHAGWVDSEKNGIGLLRYQIPNLPEESNEIPYSYVQPRENEIMVYGAHEDLKLWVHLATISSHPIERSGPSSHRRVAAILVSPAAVAADTALIAAGIAVVFTAICPEWPLILKDI